MHSAVQYVYIYIRIYIWRSKRLNSQAQHSVTLTRDNQKLLCSHSTAPPRTFKYKYSRFTRSLYLFRSLQIRSCISISAVCSPFLQLPLLKILLFLVIVVDFVLYRYTTKQFQLVLSVLCVCKTRSKSERSISAPCWWQKRLNRKTPKTRNTVCGARESHNTETTKLTNLVFVPIFDLHRVTLFITTLEGVVDTAATEQEIYTRYSGLGRARRY